jgi:hypothetical protein
MVLIVLAGCATTPLRDAVGMGDINTVKDILDKGGDVNEKYYGIPLLHVTVVDPVWGLNEIGCRTEMAKFLLDRGAEQIYNNEQTPQLIMPKEKQKMLLKE